MEEGLGWIRECKQILDSHPEKLRVVCEDENAIYTFLMSVTDAYRWGIGVVIMAGAEVDIHAWREFLPFGSLQNVTYKEPRNGDFWFYL